MKSALNDTNITRSRNVADEIVNHRTVKRVSTKAFEAVELSKNIAPDNNSPFQLKPYRDKNVAEQRAVTVGSRQKRADTMSMPGQLKADVGNLSDSDMGYEKAHYNYNMSTFQMKEDSIRNENRMFVQEVNNSCFQKKEPPVSSPGTAVIQQMPIAKLEEKDKSDMKLWVQQGKYQEVLDFLISKFPEAQIKQGKANVKNVSDFRQVVDESEIPAHGGFGVTLGGKMNAKNTIPDVYISDEHIKNWVESDQFGSLVNTIQHELTHAHQNDDDAFIDEFGKSQTRIHVMEFEAFAGEIRNAYRALKAINFEESRAGTVEWPTQADLILAYENMNKHYARMSKPEQEKYQKQYTAVKGYYPVVIDFLDRYYNPASLYQKFETSYSQFVQVVPSTFTYYTNIIKSDLTSYKLAITEYNNFNDSLSSKELTLIGISKMEEFNKRKGQRESIKKEMISAKKKQTIAFVSLKKTYSDFYNSWQKVNLKVYQIYNGLNTSEQKQFKKYTEMFDILPARIPDFKEDVSEENVTSVVLNYKQAVDKWNSNAQEIIYLSANINFEPKPKPVTADLNNIVVPPAVKEVREEEEDPFNPAPSAEKEYIKQLDVLAGQSEYVRYHLQNIAPDGYEKFSLSLLRKNLIAAKQGDLTWKHIIELKEKKESVALKLGGMEKLWFKNMNPLQLYTFYEELKRMD